MLPGEPVMCDARWTIVVLLAALVLVAWLVNRLLRHHRHGNAHTAAIIAKLRQEASPLADAYAGIRPRELARQLKRDHALRSRISEQDYALLQRALNQQFFLAIGVNLGAMLLVALSIFTLVQLQPRPPRITRWDLRSANLESEGRAVDTDDLLLSWKAEGCAADMELWLENVETGKAIRAMHTSSGQQQIRLPRGSYRELLATRAPESANRVRAVAKTAGGAVVSPEWDLHVGITVLVYTDSPEYVYVTTLIDGATQHLPQYAVRGALITWDQKPSSEGGGVGTEIEDGWFKNPSAKVPLPRQLRPEEWRRLAFAYYGEDSWRVRQEKKLPLELVEEKLLK